MQKHGAENAVAMQEANATLIAAAPDLLMTMKKTYLEHRLTNELVREQAEKREQQLRDLAPELLEALKDLASLGDTDANPLAESKRYDFLKYAPEFRAYVNNAKELIKRIEL